MGAGVAIALTEREAAVLIAAAADEPVPPHPYREQWELEVMLACKDSACPFCPEPIPTGVEIAGWPVTAQWGHRACVEANAVAEPPTKERRRTGVENIAQRLRHHARDPETILNLLLTC